MWILIRLVPTYLGLATMLDIVMHAREYQGRGGTCVLYYVYLVLYDSMLLVSIPLVSIEQEGWDGHVPS